MIHGTRVSQAFRYGFTTLLFIAVFFQTHVAFAASPPTDPVSTPFQASGDAEVGVADRRHEFAPMLMPRQGKRVIPNLAELRSTYLKERGFEGLPVPGGLGSGTLYKQGELPASFESELRTWMIVYPEGMELPPNWIFTTATNRTEKTVEVVGTYFGADPGGLGIFDCSCLPDGPCPNGSLEPSWQWTRLLSSLSCYYQEGNAGGGHRDNLLYYANHSEKLDQAYPPLWHNSAQLWNYCTRVWDLVYTHEFRIQHKDCTG